MVGPAACMSVNSDIRVHHSLIPNPLSVYLRAATDKVWDEPCYCGGCFTTWPLNHRSLTCSQPQLSMVATLRPVSITPFPEPELSEWKPTFMQLMLSPPCPACCPGQCCQSPGNFYCEDRTSFSDWTSLSKHKAALTHKHLLYPLGPGGGVPSSVQSLSRVWLFVTPWTAALQASLSITNSQSLLKFMSIESVMPSNHIILCCPLLLLPSIFRSIRVFSNESALHIRWPKYWSFSFSISPSNEYSGLISFRTDWLDLLAVQGTLKSLLQHPSSKASILQRSAFFIVQLSHPYMTPGPYQICFPSTYLPYQTFPLSLGPR